MQTEHPKALRLLHLLHQIEDELCRYKKEAGEDFESVPSLSVLNGVDEAAGYLDQCGLRPSAARLRKYRYEFVNQRFDVLAADGVGGDESFRQHLEDLCGPFPAPLDSEQQQQEVQRDRRIAIWALAIEMADFVRELLATVERPVGEHTKAPAGKQVRSKHQNESAAPHGRTAVDPADADGSDTHGGRLKPSHAKAKALYEWAVENIDGAEDLTQPGIFRKLQNDPRCDGEGLPSNAAAFTRYLRAAGIRRNTPRRSKGPTRSVRRASDL